MYKLIIEDDEGKTTVVPLIRDEITVGRKEGNTIRLTERNVSRRHAKLIKQNGAVFIEDLASYNGIKVNGNKITGRVAIAEGDRIQIGDYVLGLKIEGQVVVETAAPAEPKKDLPAVPTAPPEAQTDQIDVSKISEDEPEPPVEEQVDKAEDQLARLVCVSSNFAGAEFPLDKSVMVIGRTDDNDVVVNHRSISRHHARVLEENGRYTIVDLQSANGVRVNGEEYGKVELRKGDLIDLGHVRLRFVGEGEIFVLKDSDIVDPGKIGPGSTGGRWWVAIALVAVVGVAFLLWKLISKPPDTKPRGQITDTTPGTKPGSAEDQTDLLSKINTALQSSAWDQALTHCRELKGDAKTSAKDSCDRAAAESAAKKLFDDANAAATKNEHKRALVLFHKIPKTSQYYGEMERSAAYIQARKKYKAAGLQSIEEKVKSSDCDGAKAVAAEMKTLLPDESKAFDDKVSGCKTTVAVVTKAPPKGRKPKGRRPKTKTKTKVKVTKVPVKAGPTPEEIAKAKEERAKMWDAYRKGYHQRALASARLVLKVYTKDQAALSIFGAAACHLKRTGQAQWAFNRLQAARRQLLRGICDRKGVKLK